MIVREIIKHPELLETFDWFNDYHDTRLFVEEHHPDMLPQFLAAYLAAGALHGKSEGDHQIAAQGTPAGMLLRRMGWDYWNTESSARRVAEYAAAEIEALRTERDSLAHRLNEPPAKMRPEPKKPKTKAIHHARRNVKLTETGRDIYTVTQYDPIVKGWRQGCAQPYEAARVEYCQALLNHAREFLDKTPTKYDGGPWTIYV